MIFKILLCAGIVALFVAIVVFLVVAFTRDSELECASALSGIIVSMFVFLVYFAEIQTVHQILYGSYIT